jgi:uncharacterized alkaline shock family protein YloU
LAVKSNSDPNRKGAVAYGRNVIVSIITLAAREISGVANLQGKCVRIDFDESRINVDVYINIYYNNHVSDVAYRVQENIKRSVETMSGYKVGVVNVSVLGVTFADDII